MNELQSETQIMAANGHGMLQGRSSGFARCPIAKHVLPLLEEACRVNWSCKVSHSQERASTCRGGRAGSIGLARCLIAKHMLPLWEEANLTDGIWYFGEGVDDFGAACTLLDRVR